MFNDLQLFKQKNSAYKNVDLKLKVDQKNYTFELPIPYGKRSYIKLKYGFDQPALPIDLTGSHFDYVIGSTYSALELSLVKLHIRGPQWLLIKTLAVPSKTLLAYTRHEFEVDRKKDILSDLPEYNEFLISNKKAVINFPLTPPPLKILSVSIKSIKNP